MKHLIGKYASFKGRASRAEFWLIAIASFAFSLIGNWIDGLSEPRVVVAARMGIFELCAFLLFLLPFVTAGIRRLHDTNRSGWWLLLLYLPYLLWVVAADNPPAALMAIGGVLVGAVALAIILSLSGDIGENRFGPETN